jgi:triacylglycerol lipase
MARIGGIRDQKWACRTGHRARLELKETRVLRITIRSVIFAAILAAALAAPAAAAAESPSFPVSYSIPHAVAAGAQSATDGPLGANDWSCRPTREHPYPVVLVHGLFLDQVINWDTMSPLLTDNRFCVFALTYGLDGGESIVGGVTAMEQSATQLDAFVRKVLAVTRASKVDLVGHSEGTVMPRYWMEFLGGASLVSRYVMFTPIWHGTNLAGIGTVETLADQLNASLSPTVAGLFGTLTTCVACGELINTSSFIENLNAHGMALPGVVYTDVMTKYDELVAPYTSGYLNAPNVTNIVLQDQCPQDLSEHLTVGYDPTAAQDMLNALDPAHARAVPCVPVLPLVGAPAPPSGVGLSGYAPAPAPPTSRSCPSATGLLSGTALGPLELGETRAQARRSLPRTSQHGRRQIDSFCLTHGGIRAGYRADRLVFAITANHHYKLGRIRIGQRWSKTTDGARIGTTACYLLRGVAANGVVRVAGGRVREIGIVDKRLTATRQLLTIVC